MFGIIWSFFFYNHCIILTGTVLFHFFFLCFLVVLWSVWFLYRYSLVDVVHSILIGDCILIEVSFLSSDIVQSLPILRVVDSDYLQVSAFVDYY